MSREPRRDLALAAASGLVLGAAFLPVPLPALAWCAFVPLLLVLERRVAAGASLRSLFGLGYVAGFAFFLTGMHWIALLDEVALTVPVLKYVGWLLAGGYLALYWGLAVWLAGWLARRSGVPARFTFVAAMLVVEELRGSGELGFPWFQPGYSQHTVSAALALASLGSVTLVTLWVLLLNASLAGLWRSRTPRAALLLGVVLALPWLQPAAWRAPDPGAGRPRVALIQGNIPGRIKWSGDHQREILAGFIALTDSAGRSEPRPVLHVWPETATGSYLRRQIDQSLQVSALAARVGAPVFSGYADAEYGADGRPVAWNAAGQWGADGHLSERYAKRHLVPFGERMPFQWLVPWLGGIDLGQAEWQPGEHTVLLPSAFGPMGTLICFESIFPDLARRDVRAGARVLVNVTNDEWFGNSAALYQHAAMAPFRAAENGVPLIRCANTGLTLVCDAGGRVVARAPVFEPTALIASVPPPGARTLYTALGDWPGGLALVAVFALLLWPALLGGPRKRA